MKKELNTICFILFLIYFMAMSIIIGGAIVYGVVVLARGLGLLN